MPRTDKDGGGHGFCLCLSLLPVNLVSFRKLLLDLAQVWGVSKSAVLYGAEALYLKFGAVEKQAYCETKAYQEHQCLLKCCELFKNHCHPCKEVHPVL